jgi:four helix bundle protein
MGSACELEYHLLLGRDVGFLKIVDYEVLNREVIEIKQMLSGFIKKLKAEN